MTALDLQIDWTGCENVARVPGKVSGRPIVRGTRIIADTLIEDSELGSSPEESHENYPDVLFDLIAVAAINSASFSRSRRPLARGCRPAAPKFVRGLFGL
jgi:uncharacterized protein (DUF433 family)